MAQSAKRTDTYSLQCGIVASCRLTAQHHLITQRIGGLIYPAISNEIRSRKDLAIADVGCGNGIWAIEAAEEYPLAEVIGIDISDAQFPWTCPENCCFHVLDMMRPVDQDYKGCFDLINVRLLAGSLEGKEFTPIIDNLHQMLKPNGWIQWLDISSPAIRAYDYTEPSVISEWRLPSPITTQIPLFIKSVKWFDKLPALLKQRGFIDIERYECPPKESTLKHEAEITVLVLMELGQSLSDVEPAAAEKFNDAIAEMLEGIQDGRLFTTVLQTTIGRKLHRALRKRKPKANMALEWLKKEREDGS